MIAVTARAALLALLWLPLAAAAQSDPAAEAKRLKDRGAQAIAHQDYAAALDAFVEAYGILPSPNLRYDVAVALDGLGRAAEAAQAFADFLAAAPHAPAAARAYAQQRLDDLHTRVARIRVHIEPADAQVTVDGAALGGRELMVAPGTHAIAASRAGHAPFARQLELAAAEMVTIDEVLRPLGSGGPPPRPTLAPAAAVAVAPAPPPSAPRWRTRAGLGLTIAGRLISAGGIVLGALAQVTSDDLSRLNRDGQRFNLAEQNAGEAYQKGEIALLVIGPVVTAGGVVLYVMSKRRR